jgi:hypothetical protein
MMAKWKARLAQRDEIVSNYELIENVRVNMASFLRLALFSGK